jgi:hypothetical protein
MPSKCFWAKPFRTEASSFMIVTLPMVMVSFTSLGLCVVVPRVVTSMHLSFRLSGRSAQPIIG